MGVEVDLNVPNLGFLLDINISNGCKMNWSFFGNDRGKGPHDGTRTIIKRFLRREQLNVHGEKLQNVEEVVTFLRKDLSDRPKTSYVGARKPIKRLFWHIKLDDVIQNNSSCNCDLVKGSMKLHSIFASNKHNLILFWLRILLPTISYVWITSGGIVKNYNGVAIRLQSICNP